MIDAALPEGIAGAPRARCLRRLGRAGDRDALARRRLRPHLRRRPGRSSAHPQEPRADGRRPVGGASCAATCSPRLRAAAFSAAPSIWCSSTRPTRWGAAPVEGAPWGICGSGGALRGPGRSPCTSNAARDCGARPEGFEILREKRYGICAVDLLRLRGGDNGQGTAPVAGEEMRVWIPASRMCSCRARSIPLRYGHLDVVRRARRLCPRVTVAGPRRRSAKTASAPPSRSMSASALAREALEGLDGVEVLPFTGLLVDFAREVGAGAVVKGLRAMTDFEYELQQAGPQLSARRVCSRAVFVMSSPRVRLPLILGGAPDRLVRRRRGALRAGLCRSVRLKERFK